MEEYHILNAVKPKFLRTKYPYNWVSPEKILLTQKKITIMSKELHSDTKQLNTKPSNTNKLGGGDALIVFYG